ncbi:hypothetical protein C3L33_23170, partial [Rhododendron williamsianum]
MDLHKPRHLPGTSRPSNPHSSSHPIQSLGSSQPHEVEGDLDVQANEQRAITARFFRSLETVVKHSRTVVEIDPSTNSEVVRLEKVWNYTIAGITLLAFGTSFPQISLATIDAIRNLGNLYAGGACVVELLVIAIVLMLSLGS